MAKRIKNGAPQAIKVTVDGRVLKYKSHAEAARANKVKPGTLSLRLKKGWTLKQALGLSHPPKKANVHKKIQIGNTVFDSIADASRSYGIKSQVVSCRLRKGWTAREALGVDTPPPKNKPEGKKITVKINGKKETFNSISDAARHFGILPKKALQRLMTYGWTLEQTLGLATPPGGGGWSKPIQIRRGKTAIKYESIKEAAEAFNIDYDVAKTRLNTLGWTPEQAFELEAPPKHAKGCIGYVYKVTNTKNKKVYIGQTKTTLDVRWEQHIETALHAKTPKKEGLHAAIEQYGPDSFICEALEAADSIDKLNRLERKYIIKYSSLDPDHGYNLTRGGSGFTGGKIVFVQGKKYDSLASAARAFGVKPKIAHQRIKTSGYTIEQALEIEPPPEGSSGPKSVIVNDRTQKNIEFKSHKAAARHYGVSYKLFHQRMNRLGWSIEQALGLEKRPERIHKGKSLTVKQER